MRAQAFALLALVGLLLIACSGQAPTAPAPAEQPTTAVQPTSAPAPSAKVKSGMVTTVGGRGDLGFNDLAWAGHVRAQKELGADIQILEPTSPSQYNDDLSKLAQGGYLTFGVGYLFTDAISETAKTYPKAHFAIIDSVVDSPNVESLTFHEEQGSFLAGVLAAKMTEMDTPYTKKDTKVVGFLGALPIPIIQKFEAGYVAGVKYVDPSIQVIIKYAGTDANAFVNPTAGYELSMGMINQGADIIYHAAGSTGAGVFKAAKEKNIFAIGVDTDQGKAFPDSPILTSMQKRVDEAVFQTIKDEADGKFQGGKQRVFGIPEGGIALAPFGRFDNLVPQDVKDLLKKVQDDIVAGKIQVPTAPAQ